MAKVRLVQGNEACALGALAAGATFYAGYPITPSTEIAEYMSQKMPPMGRKFIQMEDEIASMGAIIGASCVGHKAFTATSGPGFSLMQELIGYAAITEVPIVVVDVMRGGPSTGLPTLPSQGDVQQARWGTHGDHSIIALSPSSVTETYYTTIEAFNLAEQYRTPVVLLIDEKIGHLRERFDVDAAHTPAVTERKKPEAGKEYIPYENTADGVPPFVAFGQGEHYHVTGLTHNEKGFYSSVPGVVDQFVRRLSNKIEENVDAIWQDETMLTEDAEILLVAYGSVARSSQEAVLELRQQGIKAGLLRPITLWPFHDARVASVIAGKKAVVVPEMNLNQYGREVARVAGSVPVFSLSRVDGDLITPGQIMTLVKEVL